MTERKVVLPPVSNTLASIVPPAGGDLRSIVYQIAEKVDATERRLGELERELKIVKESGEADHKRIDALDAEISTLKESLKGYAETLGAIMAAQASFEKTVNAKLNSIASTTTSTAIDVVENKQTAATKKTQWTAVIAGAIASPIIHAFLDWLSKQ